MVNGKPGDHPYTDIVGHEFDLGEPEVAARIREVDDMAELGVKEIISDLVENMFWGSGGRLDDYNRQRLLKHLDTIEKLCAGAGAKK